MKFGETFTEYLNGDQEGFLDQFSHVEYKRLKKVLKSCRTCRTLKGSSEHQQLKQTQQQHHHNRDGGAVSSEFCQCESCPLCDEMFFSELKKEVSDIAGCFSSRVRRLLHLHMAHGMQRYIARLRKCFKDDQQLLVQEGRMLIEYITMNAVAIRKILKKYDKIHSSVNGMKFKSKLREERIEILQSPWLIELGAFYMNFRESNGGESNEFQSPFSYDLRTTDATMTLLLPDLVKLEYNLTCPICLVRKYIRLRFTGTY
ncbi:OLC1v1033969C4 [Oldenlandia corymbosa var. corymbosa]|uniref:RING-type E3 ubiquitin transferase n=1 Tax=Oldenlandia corymbosa var. corymbosa TaxID=529605 RepID=A0AAV1CQ84_OLDCO|nr:OLC1v1033969C4 [Oldenlandia corymbosa var. corymbosa]